LAERGAPWAATRRLSGPRAIRRIDAPVAAAGSGDCACRATMVWPVARRRRPKAGAATRAIISSLNFAKCRASNTSPTVRLICI